MNYYKCLYHLSPKTGYMNDPNGLCLKNGIYHIYYQHAPEYPQTVKKQWGHFSTENFTEYFVHSPLIKPNSEFDIDGVYSGSAVVNDGGIDFYFTGNVRVGNSRRQNTLKVTSAEGFICGEKELLFSPEDYPEDMSPHVRDPFVFRKGNKSYMLLGAKSKSNRALCLIYKSSNKKNWSLSGRITANNANNMWECPQYIEGYFMYCGQTENENSVESNSYYAVALDCITEKSVALGRENLFDYGFDFYAPQCFFDGTRYILHAWLGNPTAGYIYSEESAGYVHCLSIPRILRFTKSGISQHPLPELRKLRQKGVRFENSAGQTKTVNSLCFEVYIAPKTDDWEISVRGVKLCAANGQLTLTVNSGGRTQKTMPYKNKSIRIFSDTSSFELFCAGRTFSSRVYFGEPEVKQLSGKAFVRLWEMKPIIITDR